MTSSKVQRQIVAIVKANVSQEEEAILDAKLDRNDDAHKDQISAIEYRFSLETQAAIDRLKHLQTESIDSQGNPRLTRTKFLFPIDPMTGLPYSGHNQFWNGDTPLSKDAPEDLTSLQGRPTVDTEDKPVKSDRFDIEVETSNRVEMRFSIPLFGGESRVKKDRTSKSPVKANAAIVTGRLARYG